MNILLPWTGVIGSVVNGLLSAFHLVDLTEPVNQVITGVLGIFTIIGAKKLRDSEPKQK